MTVATAQEENVPNTDVWGWTAEKSPDVGALLDIKKAILVHPTLRARLESHLGEVGERADTRTEGLARWMLAQYHRAGPLLNQADEKDPVVAFARAECFLKGRVAAGDRTAMRRPDLAASILAKHPALKKDARVYSRYLDALLFDGEVDGARQALESAPDEIKNGATGAYVEGRIAEAEGDYRQAKSRYLKAIERDPGHRAALLRLAYQLDLGGDDTEALEYYKRLVGLRPLDLHAALNYGVLLEDHGRNREALAIYRKVVLAFPTHARAQSYLRDAEASMNMVFDEDTERRHDKRHQMLRVPVSDFELSVRARNCLSKMGVETLGDLVQRTESELLAYKNFGETSLAEIRILLDSKGLRLGMNLDEDPIPEILAPLEKALPPIEIPAGVDPNVMNRVLADLDLSVRCRKALAQLKAVTVGDIMRHTEVELLSLKNFGQTSLNELKARLTEFGVGLREE